MSDDWQKDWARRFVPKGTTPERPAVGCDAPADQQLLKGIGEFNDGEWFECHETLEELWIGAHEPVRDLYQGILQVAVALHHWRNGNFKGATLLFTSGSRLLGHVTPACRGIDVAALLRETNQVHRALLALGPEAMTDLDRSLIPRIRLLASSPPAGQPGAVR